MTPILLAIYVLIWPLIVAGVLIVLVAAFYRDWRRARKQGRMIV
jgi:hypothetical protein